MRISFEKYLKAFWISAVIGIGISYSSLYLYHVLLVGLLVFVIVKNKFILQIPGMNTRYHYMFFWLFIWYSFSTLWSLHPVYTLSYLFIIFCGVALSLSIIYFAKDLEKLNICFSVIKAIVIVEIIIALLECLGILRLPVSPFSKISHCFGREMANPMKATLGIFHVPTAFSWNPNNLAVVLNIFLPFFLFNKKLLTKYLGSVSIFLIILVTSSRAGLLTYLVELFLYLFLFSKKRVLISSIIIGITLIFMVFFTINSKNSFIISTVQESYQALNSFLFEKSKYEDSIGLRQKYISNGMNQLKQTYFWGVGGGNSGNIEFHQNVPYAEKIPRISMHNFWIEILVDGGLIFAVMFYTWYVLLIYESKKIIKKTNDPELKFYASSIFVSLTGFITGAVSTSSVIYELPMWILIGLTIAVINIYYDNRDHQESSVIVNRK